MSASLPPRSRAMACAATTLEACTATWRATLQRGPSGGKCARVCQVSLCHGQGHAPHWERTLPTLPVSLCRHVCQEA
jgi:hypothetical protein